MAEGRQIEFWSNNFPPDPKHVPNSNVIEHQEWSRREGDLLEPLEERFLEDYVLGTINEYQVGVS
jgi:hypothetical protein